MKAFFAKIRVFLEMIKFEHSVFALPFAYLGLLFAEKKIPSFYLFFWITAAMVSFRTMAMALNRILDREIDAVNPRTKDRALPRQALRMKFVWCAVLISFCIFEISAWKLGKLCFLLTPIPFALAWMYPLMKRFSWLSHMVLGLVLGIAPYGAWIASRQTFEGAPLFLTAGVMFWVTGFDIIYALQDRDFDQKQGLFSFPAKFGEQAAMKVTAGLHFLAFLCWGIAGWINHQGLLYALGLVFVAYLLVREHLLIKTYGMAKLQEAFFSMNASVSLSLFLFTLLGVLF